MPDSLNMNTADEGGLDSDNHDEMRTHAQRTVVHALKEDFFASGRPAGTSKDTAVMSEDGETDDDDLASLLRRTSRGSPSQTRQRDDADEENLLSSESFHTADDSDYADLMACMSEQQTAADLAKEPETMTAEPGTKRT